MDRTFETLELDRVGGDGRVARVTLNRPEKMNRSPRSCSSTSTMPCTTSKRMTAAGSSSCAALVAPSARATTLRRRAGGADAVVRRHKQTDDKGRRLLMGTRTGMQQVTDIHMYFWNMAKVTIAQIHGYAPRRRLRTGDDG